MNEGDIPGAVMFELHGSRIALGPSLQAEGAVAIRAAIEGRRAALITDSNVAPLHGEPLARRLGIDAGDCFVTPAGEASKSRAEWSRLTDVMLALGFGRDSAIVAVGGGVVGDLAGFVAATYMRGIPIVQVPTTLLAMIDASIGGKTGIDTPAGKNLVGAFHHPALVLADPETLRTLPMPQLRNGLAEALKHALITSENELAWLRASAAAIYMGDGAELAALARRNIRIKTEVVRRDERESGLRKTLNFGHTIGHAIENVSEYEMLHGECIAIGMLVEARIAVLLGIAKPALVDRVTSALAELGLPGHVPGSMSSSALIAATRSDKKARGGAVEYALASDVGQMAGSNSGYGTAVPDSIVAEALAATR